MASSELSARQAEVEQARARLSDTLDKLTSSTGSDNLKQELIGQVQGYKDQLITQAKDKSRDTIQQITDDLKRRVMANPTGAALIGAGVLWRLYKHPPVTTLLIGAGAAMLMRSGGGSSQAGDRYHDPYRGTDPATYVPGGVAGYGYPVEGSAPGPTVGERIEAVTSEVSEKAHEVGSRARDVVSDAGARVSAVASDAGARVSTVADRARAQALETAERVRSTALDTAGRVRSQVTDATDRVGTALSQAVDRTRSEVSRVGNAVGDLAERTSTELTGMARHTARRAGDVVETAQESPVVLGTLGLAAGIVIARALSQMEVVHRAYDTTSDAFERGSRYAGSRLSEAARRTADVTSDAVEGVGDAASRAARTAAELATSTSRHVTDSVAGAGRHAADLASGTASDTASAMSGAARSVRRHVSDTFASDDEDQGMRRPPRGAPMPRRTPSAYDRVSEVYDDAIDEAYDAGRRVVGLGRRAQDEVADLAERYPLLLGAIALAAGAAVGGVLRLTDSEARLIGPVGDQLKSRAQRLAQEHLEGFVGAAEHLGQELQGKVAEAADRNPTRAEPGAKFTDADLGTVVGGRSTAKAESIGPSGQPGSGPGRTGA